MISENRLHIWSWILILLQSIIEQIIGFNDFGFMKPTVLTPIGVCWNQLIKGKIELEMISVLMKPNEWFIYRISDKLV